MCSGSLVKDSALLYEDVEGGGRHEASIPVVDPKADWIGLTVRSQVLPLT